MNRRNVSLNLLLFLLFSFFTMPALLRAAEDASTPITVSLQFTTTVKDPVNYISVVPRSVGGMLTVPLQTAPLAKWLVEIDFDFDDAAKTFLVRIVDPTLVGPVNPIQLLEATFPLVFGKAITVLNSTLGTLEITLTKE